MIPPKICQIQNGQALLFPRIPCLPFEEFRQIILESVVHSSRVVALFAMEPGRKSPLGPTALRLIAVLANDYEKWLGVLSTEMASSYPSLTPQCPQVHLFEREMAEQWGLIPEGHPWLRPVRFHPSFRPDHDLWPVPAGKSRLPGVTDFFHMSGEETHEVAVGPVHAGVIEPGHFRFQCHGEKVFHLEISLGYQHRGIEKTLLGGPHKRTMYHMETIAGDTSVGHALAYCQAMEGLRGIDVSPRAHALRAIGLELERLANHTGDLGALSGDVGFLPTAAFCGRIRGDFLNMTALLCGSRLGRGLVRPGTMPFDLDSQELVDKLMKSLDRAEEDVRVAVELLWDTPTVMSRFEMTGAVSLKDCSALGLVGPAARACGSQMDIRLDFPTGHYKGAKIPAVPEPSKLTGDVEARAYVRWAEIQNSMYFLKKLLPQMPSENGPETKVATSGGLSPDSFVVSLVEGWRGEICHVAVTDATGHFARYKIIDPSFHNWIGLGMALRNQEISDFPLCNKSFNLSYCGFDL